VSGTGSMVEVLDPNTPPLRKAAYRVRIVP
jgi:hypothetical protein